VNVKNFAVFLHLDEETELFHLLMSLWEQTGQLSWDLGHDRHSGRVDLPALETFQDVGPGGAILNRAPNLQVQDR